MYTNILNHYKINSVNSSHAGKSAMQPLNGSSGEDSRYHVHVIFIRKIPGSRLSCRLATYTHFMLWNLNKQHGRCSKQRRWEYISWSNGAGYGSSKMFCGIHLGAISKEVLTSTSFDIALRWMPQNSFDDKSILVQVMVWFGDVRQQALREPMLTNIYGITTIWRN